MGAIDREQDVTPLNPGEFCQAFFVHVQEVPLLYTVVLKGSDSRTDGMLRQEPLGSLVIEDGMTAPKFRQRSPDALLELIEVPGQQGSCAIIESPSPFVIWNCSNMWSHTSLATSVGILPLAVQ